MPPRVDPVRTTPELPAEVDVVVIGGGIIGASNLAGFCEEFASLAITKKSSISMIYAVAVLGDCSEPVSTLKFPDPRQNTGNFR